MSSAILRTYDTYVRYASDHSHVVICEIEGPEHTTTGTAKCSPLDEFDETIGRRIAFARAAVGQFGATLATLFEDGVPPTWVLPQMAVTVEEIEVPEYSIHTRQEL